MSEGKKIYSAIAAAMKDIDPIAKGSRNQQQGFMFRGVDAVMNELQPVLAKHGIFITPEVLIENRETRLAKSGGAMYWVSLKTAFHFCADDGSEIIATVIGEAMDSGDKASNKALSIAFKYACLQVFCIPTEDTKDPDFDTPPETLRPPNPPQGPAKAPDTAGAGKTTPPPQNAPQNGWKGTVTTPGSEPRKLTEAKTAAWRLAQGNPDWERWYREVEDKQAPAKVFLDAVALWNKDATTAVQMAQFEKNGAPVDDGEIPFFADDVF